MGLKRYIWTAHFQVHPYHRPPPPTSWVIFTSQKPSDGGSILPLLVVTWGDIRCPQRLTPASGSGQFLNGPWTHPFLIRRRLYTWVDKSAQYFHGGYGVVGFLWLLFGGLGFVFVCFVCIMTSSCVWRSQMALITGCVLSRFASVWLFATLSTVARQAPLSMGVSGQKYWRGWVAMPSARGSSWTRDWTSISYLSR